MIGAGLFALIGIAVEIAGRAAYLAFIIAGVVAFLTSYSVARLAVRFPCKGGMVAYINQGFGTGIYSGTLNIIMWIGYIIVTSLYARAFGEYCMALLGLDDEFWLHIFCSSVLIFFVFVNFLGAAIVGTAEVIIVSAKVLILLFFGVLGLTTLNVEQVVIIQQEFDLRALTLASGVIFMAYEGFGLAANAAEDVTNPKKNIPRALYLSVAIVMVIYLMVSIAVIGNLSVAEIINAKEYALAEAARPIMGPTGFTIMGIAALFSITSAINATVYGAVYMLHETAIARQISPFFIGTLFKHKSGQSLLVTGLLVLIIANLLELESIAEAGSMIFLLVYTAVNIVNFRLRKETSSNPWIIGLGIMGTGLILLTLGYYLAKEGNISVYLFLAILIGGFIYQLYYQNRKQSV